MGDCARIVLPASGGTASRTIAREAGCAPGMACKWRVCYANIGTRGLSETGDRGTERKYGHEHGQRILLDVPPPAGYFIWTAPSLAGGPVEIHRHYIWRFNLRLTSGRATIGQSYDYKTRGTASLFVALDVGPGQLKGKHYERRRQVAFRDFMNRIVKQHEGKEIQLILNDLPTHKLKRVMRLKR